MVPISTRPANFDALPSGRQRRRDLVGLAVEPLGPQFVAGAQCGSYRASKAAPRYRRPSPDRRSPASASCCAGTACRRRRADREFANHPAVGEHFASSVISVGTCPSGFCAMMVLVAIDRARRLQATFRFYRRARVHGRRPALCGHRGGRRDRRVHDVSRLRAGGDVGRSNVRGQSSARAAISVPWVLGRPLSRRSWRWCRRGPRAGHVPFSSPRPRRPCRP